MSNCLSVYVTYCNISNTTNDKTNNNNGSIYIYIYMCDDDDDDDENVRWPYRLDPHRDRLSDRSEALLMATPGHGPAALPWQIEIL